MYSYKNKVRKTTSTVSVPLENKATKEISYKVKEYYYSKLLNIRKFNLDYETFFLEFEDNLLNG